MSAPVVLLHPLGADGGFWAPVQAALSDREVVAIDLPGHGGAPALPKGTGVEGYSAVVAEQLESVGAPVTLVGMSLGGLVAQQLGAARPDLLASVVLVDTVAIYPEPMQQMWRDRAATARRDGLASLVEPMVTMWFTDELAAAGDSRVTQARKTFESTDPEGYARACDLLADADLREAVRSIDVPTVVVCGRDDTAPFRDAALWLAERTGDGTVRWLPGKHACAIEAADEFAALLTDL